MKQLYYIEQSLLLIPEILDEAHSIERRLFQQIGRNDIAVLTDKIDNLMNELLLITVELITALPFTQLVEDSALG